MRIPRAEHAVVSPTKVRDYLLCIDHRVGGPKAQFFGRLGYKPTDWPVLLELLRATASLDATATEVTRFGRKFLVHAALPGPNGRTAHIVVVWIILAGDDAPRLVTAYPGEPHDA